MYQNSYNGYFNPQAAAQLRAPAVVTPNLKGRPVSSLEEARATSIDFDGSIFFFPDIANRRIYTKQINMDGTSSLNVYEYKEISMADPGYVTRQEFNSALEEIRSILNAQLQPREEIVQQQQQMPVAQTPVYNF